MVDCQSSAAGERDAILKSMKGLACKSGDLTANNREDGREFVNDKRVVYDFHNIVNAASTEDRTFKAGRHPRAWRVRSSSRW